MYIFNVFWGWRATTIVLAESFVDEMQHAIKKSFVVDREFI